jgi:hypothetical protein
VVNGVGVARTNGHAAALAQALADWRLPRDRVVPALLGQKLSC